jgi:uncharacterized protein (DUF1800 family)
VAGVPVFRGRFGPAEAERLLWRAGFGPRRGEAARLAKTGLTAAVHSLTRPGAEQLDGPEPRDERGNPIAPYDAVGHDHMWWLDRMVRSSNQLVERMTLIWHDWFATAAVGVGSQRRMLDQNALLRRHALGSFADMLLEITKDPAMLVWLSGVKNTRLAPNENYARELMELFTLGAGRGYTESDVREQARALTGWRARRAPGRGPYDFYYEPRLHDAGSKTVFGKSGNYDWQGACRLCLENRNHPSFFIAKLWSYFIPTAPSRATQGALESLYGGKREIRPVVEAILQHPDLYRGPRMVKPPVVYTAGLLRALGQGVSSANWARLGATSGQRLFHPPNVAGWDDTRWLDTSTFRGRWYLAGSALAPLNNADSAAGLPRKGEKLLERTVAFFGNPALSKETRGVLVRFADAALAQNGPAVVENALRQLVAISPDHQTC